MNETLFWITIFWIFLVIGLVIYIIWKGKNRWKVILLKDHANPRVPQQAWIGAYNEKKNQFEIYKNDFFYLFAPFKKVGIIEKCNPWNFGVAKIIFVVRNITEHPSEDSYVPISVIDLYEKTENKLEKTNILLRTQLDAATQAAEELENEGRGLLSFLGRYPWLLPTVILIFVVVVSLAIYWYGFADMITKVTGQASKSIINATQEALGLIAKRGW
jgi:hypothetical protein